MVNLAKTQNQFDVLFKKFGLFIEAFNVADELAKKLGKDRVVVDIENDVNSFTSSWAFTGLKRGVNSDDDAGLFITITDEAPGAGQATIDVFSDSARSVKVATGNGADSTTITLSEFGNSGLSGSVDIIVVTATVSNVDLKIQIDFLKQSSDLFTNNEIEFKTKNTLNTSLLDNASSAEDIRDEFLSVFTDDFLLTDVADFLKTDETVDITPDEAVGASGAITASHTGVLQELTDAMNDNTVPQNVLVNTTSNGSPTADPDNVGVGTIDGVVLKEWVISGEITIKCTNETLGAEKFSVILKRTDNGEVIEGLNSATIKQLFKSNDIGIDLTVNRTISETGDGSGQLANFTVSGETSTNTDGGKVYVNLTDTAGTRTVDVFSDSARTVKVASGTKVGDGTITLSAVGGSGLTGSVDVTFTVDDTDIVFDLQVFKLNDKFTFSVTNNEEGLFQTYVSRNFRFALESDASPTIKEKFAV